LQGEMRRYKIICGRWKILGDWLRKNYWSLTI
jgi:hypothetical protein